MHKPKILTVAKVKFPPKYKDTIQWKIITNKSKAIRSISSYVPFKVGGAWKLLYSDNTGIYETQEPFKKSNRLTNSVEGKELKVIHQLTPDKFVGLGKNSKLIYQISTDSLKKTQKIDTIPSVEKYILTIKERKQYRENSRAGVGGQENNDTEKNTTNSKGIIKEISNLRKLSKTEITYIVYLDDKDDSVYFVKQKLDNLDNSKDDFKSIELNDIITDFKINRNSLKDIKIDDNLISIVTSDGLFQRSLSDSIQFKLGQEEEIVKIPLDNVNSIDLQNNLLLVGSEDATAKLYKSYTENKKIKYQLSSTLKGHKDAILNVSFIDIIVDSTRRNYILTSGEDGSINIWDTSSLTEGTATLNHNHISLKNNFPSSMIIDSISNNNFIKEFDENLANLDSLGFNDIAIFGFDDGFNDIDFRKDGTGAFLYNDVLLFFDSNNQVNQKRGDYDTIDIISDSTSLITFNGEIFFHVKGKRKLIPIETPQHKDKIRDARLSEDGCFMVTGSNDNSAIIWKGSGKSINNKFDSYELIYTIQHNSNVNKTAIRQKTGKNSYLLATSSANIVKLHKIDTNGDKLQVTELLSLIRHDHKINSMSFGKEKDGTIIYTADEKGFINKWNWDTFEEQIREKTYGFNEVIKE